MTVKIELTWEEVRNIVVNYMATKYPKVDDTTFEFINDDDGIMIGAQALLQREK